MITRANAACKTIRLKEFRLSLRNKRSPRIRLIIPNYHNTNIGVVWHLNSGFIGTNSTIYTFFGFVSCLLAHSRVNITGNKLVRANITEHFVVPLIVCNITRNKFIITTIFCCVKTSGNKVAYYFSVCSLNRSINNRNLFRICLRQNLFSLCLRNILAFGEKTKAGTRASQCKRDKSRSCWMW